MAAMPLPTSMSVSPSAEHVWNSSVVPLGDSIRAFTLALMDQTGAAPDAHESWRGRMRGLLGPLRQAFAEHRAATEGDQGLYAEVVQDAPRLASAVHTLLAEHQALDKAMARLAHIADEVNSDAETLRQRALGVLDNLARHRQHDADLVHEAYSTDIGGE